MFPRLIRFAVLPLLSASLLAGEESAVDWGKARKFWSFQSPTAGTLPTVERADWPQTRVDHFVLAELEQRELTPSARATKRHLIRRLFFDLNGLPPASPEMEDFLKQDVEQVVESLLGRRAFGERLASLWLNLSRYAEDQAHQVGSNTTLAYPNAYRYRAWVIEAFNSDLPYDEFIRKQLAVDLLEPDNKQDLAALGYMGLGHKYYSRGRLEVQAEEWAEKVDTVSRSLLGLTVACAQCHDHKYDPITMKDYYGLAGVFASIKMVNKSADGVYEKKGAKADKMHQDTLHLIEDNEAATDLNIFLRGDVKSKGPLVPRRFLEVLAHDDPGQFKNGSGRGELAMAIADSKNPLTARVFVNRVWAMLFGRGLVGSTSNFGQLGDRPTHPELLDDLAVRFMRQGWSVKWLVRELVLSATYQQASKQNLANAKIDESNTYLWRMNRRRLSVEQLRDAILNVSGRLDREGGKSLELDDEKNLRRTVYSRVSRLQLNRTMMLFDYPDANVHASKRFSSTTAPQKLFVMNNPFVIARARDFAKRLNVAAENHSDQVDLAYRMAYGREPGEGEKAIGLQFLSQEEGVKMTALERYAQAILAANEMMYLD